MSQTIVNSLPPQRLSFGRKTTTWRKECVDCGDSFSLMLNHSAIKSVYSMNINYDLMNGKIHMDDISAIINPYNLDATFIPETIQHYPVINSKLQILKGEESKRPFNWKVVVTNPNAVSEIERTKNENINRSLQELLINSSESEEEFNRKLEEVADYYQYTYQDKREVRANRLLKHFIMELDVTQRFNEGFWDACIVGEELYQCTIIGGEPALIKIDPRKVRILRSNNSDRIEDADMIVIEGYWSKKEIIDTFWDQLKPKDIDALDRLTSGDGSSYSDAMDNIDPRHGLIPIMDSEWVAGDVGINSLELFSNSVDSNSLPYDSNGNIRVLKVYWKSLRKIKKVKSYDPDTGEEQFNFYPENYIIDPMKGEEEEIFWVNEAWEGVKIGADIYVNMHPCPIQYNRLSNPSRCHFGIIGSLYNTNGDEPYSLVDIMKPYAYKYDVYHDRLDKVVAKSIGKVIRLDFAKVPAGWDVDKWMHFLTVNGIAVEDSYKEGNTGRSTGILAGQMNNATSGVIDASLSNEILQYTSMLDWISNKIGELAGISKQREGQISNRETVGGVERATLQSSHITEWLFAKHEGVKKRVLECLLETAKIAYKGRKIKFKYLLEDGAEAFEELDGDVFSENDYGLIVDSSPSTQELNQKLDVLAQAAIQNQYSLSTVIKLFNTTSTAEKERVIELDEKKRMEQQQQQQQHELQLRQEEIQAKLQAEQQKMQLEYQMHKEDNETKILVAQINSRAEELRMSILNHDNAEANDIEREKISEQSKEFEKKLALEKEKLKADTNIKREQIKASNNRKK